MPTEYGLTIEAKQDQAPATKGVAVKAGLSKKKGWFQSFVVGLLPQRGNPGKFAFVEAMKKRIGFGNWYSEKITDRDTGEVIHECHEPLSEHQNHGSDKPTQTQSS